MNAGTKLRAMNGDVTEVIIDGETCGYIFADYDDAGRAVVVAAIRGGQRIGHGARDNDAVALIEAHHAH